jgi:spore cortex formation protein SpoVR/YcgB (stage V sporulation)
MLENSQKNIIDSTKSHIINYTSLQGKTRVESLVDRIQSVDKEISTIYRPLKFQKI